MGALNKLIQVKNFIVYAIVFALVVVIYFKNNKIDNLEKELDKQPKIEYITKVERDTIRDSIPVPKEVVKWMPSEKDTIYQPIDLTEADSAEIAKAYGDLYDTFAETKIYDDVLKDDSLAFIRVREKVQYNTVFDRELFYEHKTPTVHITKTVPDKTFSVVGGVDGSLLGLNMGVGVVTHKNSVYIFKYDPFNKTYGGAIYLPIFNF